MSENYLKEQKDGFEKSHPLMTKENHKVHNEDQEYWDILLGPIRENWKDKIGFDFGCGCGRNIKNLLDTGKFSRVDGCDISSGNVEWTKKYIKSFYEENMFNVYENKGDDCATPFKDYDFVMSHIVFQHIGNYNVRFSILKNIYDILKPNGIYSLHFADLRPGNSYYTNGTTGFTNSLVEDENYLYKDFESIGFSKVKCFKTPANRFVNGTNYFMIGKK